MPFEARDLPSVIWLGDEAIVGPFCVHCGYPLTMHGPKLECRTTPSIAFPPPSCDCHVIENVTREVMLPNGRRRRKRVVTRQEIVRKDG